MDIEQIDLSDFKKQVQQLDYNFADALYAAGGISLEIYRQLQAAPTEKPEATA